jgi:hypothetical protein
MRHELTLQTMMNLDAGRVVEAFNQAIRRVALDMDDRPGDTKSRSITLNCELVPVIDEQGQLDTVRAKFKVTDKLPARRSKVYEFDYRRGGQTGLVFNDLSDDSAKQMTIDHKEDDNA